MKCKEVLRLKLVFEDSPQSVDRQLFRNQVFPCVTGIHAPSSFSQRHRIALAASPASLDDTRLERSAVPAAAAVCTTQWGADRLIGRALTRNSSKSASTCCGSGRSDRAAHPDGYQYSCNLPSLSRLSPQAAIWACVRHHSCPGRHDVRRLRQADRAGQRRFHRLSYLRDAQPVVAVLGHRSKAKPAPRPPWRQDLPDWSRSNVRRDGFLGGPGRN